MGKSQTQGTKCSSGSLLQQSHLLLEGPRQAELMRRPEGDHLNPDLLSRVAVTVGTRGQRDYTEEKRPGPPCISACISQQLRPSPVAKCLVLSLQSSCCLWQVSDLGQGACPFPLFSGWLHSL